jgi:uncharacterized damage-inducible protein DinB
LEFVRDMAGFSWLSSAGHGCGRNEFLSYAHRLISLSDQICDLAEQLPAPLIVWKPGADVWSILEILCHVEEVTLYWTGQTMQIVQKPAELWGRDHTNTDRKAAVENAANRDLAGVTAGIRAAARDSAAILRTLSEADLSVEATSKNPRWGVKPARFVVDDLIVGHLEKHLAQIRRNVAQYEQKGQGQ